MTALANRRCIDPGCGQWMDNRRGYQRCIACDRRASVEAAKARNAGCPLAAQSTVRFSQQWWRTWK